MKQLIISFMIFVFPHLLLSQTLNWENDKIEAIQECLEYGVFIRGDYYVCDIEGNDLGQSFNWILSPIKDYKDGYIIVAKHNTYDNMYGLYDLHTKQYIIPLQKYFIYRFGQGKYIINNEGKAYLYDAKNRRKNLTAYESIHPLRNYSSPDYSDYDATEDYFEVSCNGKKGVANREFELLIPCKYEDFELVDDNGYGDDSWKKSDYSIIQAYAKETGYKFYDVAKRKIIFNHPNYCKYIGDFNGKKCFMVEDKQYRENDRVIVDENGRRVTNERYVYVEPLKGNIFIAAQKNNQCRSAGLLNSSFKRITPFIYKDPETDFLSHAGLYHLWKDRKDGMIDTKGNVVIPFVYDNISICDKNTFIVQLYENQKWGVINTKGNTIIPCIYDNITKLGLPNLFAVEQNNKYGVIDKKGKVITPFIYDDIDFTSYPEIADILKELGLLIIKNVDSNGGFTYGFLDVRGNEVIPPMFSQNDAMFLLCQHIYNQSDVDNSIPTTTAHHPKTFALIIANENYIDSNTSKVNYAQRDGKVFKEYCQKTLGIPEENILYIQDGTLAQMYMGMSKLKDLADIYNDSKVIVYYAGHGVPDEQNTDSYLLPVDGMVNNNRTAISLSTFYDEIGKIPSKQTLVFLDACFSGSQRDGKLLSSKTRGVAIKAKAIAPKGNMIVFSASNGDEAALSYKKGKHGLFTYFLLKKLKESSGNVSLGELSTYLSQMVKKHSIIDENKKQSPTVSVAINNWETIKINENE